MHCTKKLVPQQEEKENVMRFQNIILPIVMLVLGALSLTGAAFADGLPQAAHAESAGFDALAHDLFGSNAAPLVELDGKLAEAETE